MKRYIFLLLIICIALSSCNAENAETTIETTVTETVTVISVQTVPFTAEVTTVQIGITEAQTTTEITTEETTTAATTVATTVAKPAVTYSAHVPSVLDGEYTYGGEPIIEEIDGITYVNGILIANKTYSLPDTFNPNSLHPRCKICF